MTDVKMSQYSMTDIVTDALSKSNTSFELQLIIDSEKQKIKQRKQREMDT